MPKADKSQCPGMATGKHKIVTWHDGTKRCQGCLVLEANLPSPPPDTVTVEIVFPREVWEGGTPWPARFKTTALMLDAERIAIDGKVIKDRYGS